MELAGFVLVALALVAVVSVARARHIGIPAKVGWTVVVLFLPVFGPLLWFAAGQRYTYGVDGRPRR